MIIVRRSAPCNLDEAEFGSRCIVKDNHHDEYQLYLQVHKNAETPNWEFLGIFNQQSSQFYIDELINTRIGK